MHARSINQLREQLKFAHKESCGMSTRENGTFSTVHHHIRSRRYKTNLDIDMNSTVSETPECLEHFSP